MKNQRDLAAQKVKDRIQFLSDLSTSIEDAKAEIEVATRQHQAGMEKAEALKIQQAQMREAFAEQTSRKEELIARSHAIEQRFAEYYPQLEKRILNRYLECKGNIRVFVRVRPVLAIDYKAYNGTKESFEKIAQATRVCNEKQIMLVPDDKPGQMHRFLFDQVFGN